MNKFYSYCYIDNIFYLWDSIHLDKLVDIEYLQITHIHRYSHYILMKKYNLRIQKGKANNLNHFGNNQQGINFDRRLHIKYSLTYMIGMRKQKKMYNINKEANILHKNQNMNRYNNHYNMKLHNCYYENIDILKKYCKQCNCSLILSKSNKLESMCYMCQ